METELEIDVEEIIRYQVAQKIIETIPEIERKKILEASLSKTLHDVLSSWSVKRAIESDVNTYMVEYLKHPEIQSRIKKATEDAVDKLMDGVISVIISESQKEISSGYKKFLEIENKKEWHKW